MLAISNSCTFSTKKFSKKFFCRGAIKPGQAQSAPIRPPERSELHRRIPFETDRSSVRRWALSNGCAQPNPSRPDPLPLEMVGGQRVGKHRHANFFHKDFQPLCVVAVLVGEEDAGERSRSDPASLQPGTQLASAQAGIHQNRAVSGTHQKGIPGTPAGQHSHLKHAAD